MKPLDQQDHYEVLEIARTARHEEVERAFHIAQAAYAEDSLAFYSVFDSDGAAMIRDRIETAYRVLSNDETRREYDEMVFGASGGASSDQESPSAAEYSPSTEVYREMEAEVEEKEQVFDGASLRRARLRRGVELDQIADITKISHCNLRYLEDENFGDLPANVYVRGFVTAYARAIGLDAKRVVADYMARLEQIRNTKGRGRLQGRK